MNLSSQLHDEDERGFKRLIYKQVVGKAQSNSGVPSFETFDAKVRFRQSKQNAQRRRRFIRYETEN